MEGLFGDEAVEPAVNHAYGCDSSIKQSVKRSMYHSNNRSVKQTYRQSDNQSVTRRADLAQTVDMLVKPSNSGSKGRKSSSSSDIKPEVKQLSDLSTRQSDNTVLTSPPASHSISQLAAENDSGFIEYKWKLLDKSQERISHLTTQLAYRLNEGDGTCLYQIGVLDSGIPEGLPPHELAATIRLIQSMASSVNAVATVSTVASGRHGDCAEVRVERVCKRGKSLGVALIGEAHAGKSTLLGVLCSGRLDNGRGSARLTVLKHRHEVESGHTQSINQHLIGFDANGTIVRSINQSVNLSGNQSITVDCDSILTMVDCVGHASGRRVTLSALMNGSNDYVVWVVDCLVGVSEESDDQSNNQASNRSTYVDQLNVVMHLELPIMVVLTKMDLATQEQIDRTIQQIEESINQSDTDQIRCHMVNESDDIQFADWINQKVERASKQSVNHSDHQPILPVFPFSSVTGAGLEVLSCCLSRLPKLKNHFPTIDQPTNLHCIQSNAQSNHLELSVDSVYVIEGQSVIGGLIVSGSVSVNQTVILGPVDGLVDGLFIRCVIDTIHVKRSSVKHASAGEVVSCRLIKQSFSQSPDLSVDHSVSDDWQHGDLRRGLVMFDQSVVQPHLLITRTFDARIQLLDCSIDSLIDESQIGAQYVAYLPCIRQSVRLVSYSLSSPPLDQSASPSDRSVYEYDCTFEFCHSPEYIRVGAHCLLESNSQSINQFKAKGYVTSVKGDIHSHQSTRRRKDSGKRRKGTGSESPVHSNPTINPSINLDDLPPRANTAPLICTLMQCDSESVSYFGR